MTFTTDADRLIDPVPPPGRPAHPQADDALAAAEVAARDGGLVVRELHSMPQLRETTDLFVEVWGASGAAPPVSSEMMRALSHAGNYVAAARVDGVLVGASVGFFGESEGGEPVLHSHIAGVSATARGRNVGFALKLHQRAWALCRGITLITWTYDPLVRRNAHFNIAKLGATPTEYLTNFYGRMDDAINAGEETDRLLVSWPLTAARVSDAAAGLPASDFSDAPLTVDVIDGEPVRNVLERPRAWAIRIPPDIEAIRHNDVGSARRWRTAVREELGGALADGCEVTGFRSDGAYVLAARSVVAHGL